MVMHCCYVIGRAQYIQRLNPSNTDNSIALLVRWQADHGLLGHPLAVNLLSLLLGLLTSDDIIRIAALKLLLLLLLLLVETTVSAAILLHETIDRVLLLRLVDLRVELLLLEVLERRLHLETLLQIVKGRILEPTVADKVVKLVASLDDIQVGDLIKADNILFLEDANISINI